MLTLLLSLSVLASPFFTDISEDQATGIGATWSFPIPTESGWMLGLGQQGDLTIVPMEDGVARMEEVQTLTDIGSINDHALRACPDGTYLHAASLDFDGDNIVHRFDSDFSLLATATIEQGTPPHAANDVAAICSDSFVGVGTAEQQGLRDYFWAMDDDLNLSVPIELADAPRMTGAGLWEHEELLYTVGRDARPELSVSIYDADFQLVDQALVPPISQEIVHYWPSGVLVIGDYFLMVSMGRNPDDGWPLDTGNVYLTVLDHDLDTIEWIQLTDYDPASGGGMRPWLARADNQIWLSFDRNNEVHLFSLDIDPIAFGLEDPEEVAEPESEPESEPETNDADDNPTAEKTGCASLAVFPLALLFRSRTRRETEKTR